MAEKVVIEAEVKSNVGQVSKGANNMIIEWASTIRMTQIKTGVTL